MSPCCRSRNTTNGDWPGPRAPPDSRLLRTQRPRHPAVLQMALRWCAAGMAEAGGQFRRATAVYTWPSSPPNSSASPPKLTEPIGLLRPSKPPRSSTCRYRSSPDFGTTSMNPHGFVVAGIRRSAEDIRLVDEPEPRAVRLATGDLGGDLTREVRRRQGQVTVAVAGRWSPGGKLDLVESMPSYSSRIAWWPVDV